MNRDDELRNLLKELFHKYDANEIFDEFNREYYRSKKSDVCTIIVNAGLHNFPANILRGELYVFSEGGLDMSDKTSLEDQLKDYLSDLSIFLRKNKWKDVYIVISGHAIMNMLVKLAVYRITHIDTIDWVFDGKGNYIDVQIPVRSILSRA